MRKLHRGEEISARAYLHFLVEELLANGGVMSDDDVKAAVVREYSRVWSEDDVRPSGIHGLPKWVNQVAWAKVLGKTFIRQRKYRGRLVVVDLEAGEYLDANQLDPDYHFWRDFVLAGKRKKGKFTKVCVECGSRRPLSAIRCDCGYVFPKPTRKVYQRPSR